MSKLDELQQSGSHRLPPGPKRDQEEGRLPKIYSVMPDEIRNMHPHGQWVFDRPGLVLNFATNIDTATNLPDVDTWAAKFAAFLESDEPYMEFESPHVPGIIYLHRHAAEHIICTQPAWSQKIMARTRPGGVQIVDDATGVPVLSKLRT